MKTYKLTQDLLDAYLATNVPAGQTVSTLGGTALNDGAGATWITSGVVIPGNAGRIVNSNAYDQRGNELTKQNVDVTGNVGSALVTAAGTTLARDLSERFADVINVKDFGAVGDWNAATQTGADDTSAIQAAFDFAASTGTVRSAGTPIVHFPAGNYRITSTINIRNPGGFHFEMTGEGLKSTNIFGAVGAGGVMFDSNIEFWAVSNIKFIGNSSESRTGMCKTMFFCYLSGGGADIDVTFTNCIFIYAAEMTYIVGRGFTMNNCIAGILDTLLVIKSPDPWVQRGSDFTDTVDAGMRNYAIRNTRFDVVSRIVSTHPAGPAANYINDIQITSCSGTVCDRLFAIGEYPFGLNPTTNGRVLQSSITGNNFVYSFATGIVSGYDIENTTIDGNTFAKVYGATMPIDAQGESINNVLKMDGAISGVVISDNIIRGISDYVAQCSGNLNSLTISGNNFPFYGYYQPNSNFYCVLPQGSSKGNIIIRNNNFRSNKGQPAGNTFYVPNADISADELTISGNISDFTFNRFFDEHTPVLYVGGSVAIGYTTTVALLHWEVHENYIEGWVHCAFGNITGSGDIAVDLPRIAIAESSISGAAGIGYITQFTGLSLDAGEYMSNPDVRAGNLMNLRKGTLSGSTNLAVSDTTGQISFIAQIRYRFK